MAALLCRSFDGRIAAEDDEVSEGDLLATGLGGVELLLDGFVLGDRLAQLRWLVDCPVLLRLEGDHA